ncbi:MAG TPA: ATP-dependent DNA ligase [Bryobacteraceae bacterium]|nr:ATP-dependent DNA ligase [Bryobacteraceae bacterium]
MDELALTCEQIARWNSRLRKVRILADYLRPLSDADLVRAVRFLCCGPIPAGEGKFSVGGSTLREALRLASGWDAQTLAACYAQVGDTGETVARLMRGIAARRPMSLADAELLYARVFKQRRTVDKVELLRQIYLEHNPETLKFFVKAITGNLRIGLQAKMVEEAVAEATGASLEDVRSANNRAGDLPQVALAARRGTLGEIRARLFHPMEFMLAKPLDAVGDVADPRDWWVEDKYDGFRSQIHAEGDRVAIFTRGLESVTEAFPEIVAAVKGAGQGVVLDGEVLAWRDGRALPFAVLQQRIARRKLTAELAASVPVVFVAYDVLYCDGTMLVDAPLEDRRRAMEKVVAAMPLILIAPQWRVDAHEEIDAAFTAARQRGNEGLVLKRKGSTYEAGRRSGSWLKVKRPHGSLDVVVTAAETGSGRRAIYLSDYTFAVRDGDKYLNVGKAYSGLTDEEVRELTRVLRSVSTDRFGKVTLVRPEVVLEVTFDGVQKSPRHKSGFALRFPRIVRWRRDKRPEEADTLHRVKELYEAATGAGGS